MPTFSQQFLANLGGAGGMLQGFSDLGGAIGGIGGQIKEKRFQTELSNIDTTTLAGQIEAQQKLLAREKDPRVRLQMQSDIASLRALQRKKESLESYIAANPEIPPAEQDLLRAGNMTVAQSMTQQKTRGNLNLTKENQIAVGKGRIGRIKTDEQKDFVRNLYPDVKTDDEYYLLIGGLKEGDLDDNLQAFANSNFSKGLRNVETKTDKEKAFFSELADSVDNGLINITDANAQIKLFKSGIEFTVPVEHENIKTGEIVKIVKVKPPKGEGDQYMAKLTGEGNPVRIDINNFKKTTAPTKPESIKSKEVSATDRVNTIEFLNEEFASRNVTSLGMLDNPDIEEVLVEKLSELANFIQANSPKALSNKQALKMASDEMKLSGKGGGFGDKDVVAANMDVDFDSVLKKLRGSIETTIPEGNLTEDQIEAAKILNEYKQNKQNSDDLKKKNKG